MNLIKKIFIAFLLLSANFIVGQQTVLNNNIQGTTAYVNGVSQLKVANGNSIIATSYTNTACGLGFAQVSVPLFKKNINISGSVNQPAPFMVSGIPMCNSILKAFLYASINGNGVPVNAIISNPQSITNTVSMSIIGQDASVCWAGYPYSYTYRADVTSLITGNGSYNISGIPVAPTASNDAQGATLFIIYSDPTQNYTGSIVIADGTEVPLNLPNPYFNTIISGFNVCGTPLLTTNFMIVADLQKISDTPIRLNSLSSNYTLTTANQNFYDFISDPGSPPSVGQTTANYGLSNNSDCESVILAGMYFKTSCLTCTIPPNTPTIAVSSSSNVICSGNSTTLTANGANTYTWSNGSNNSYIVITPTVSTTYTVWGNNMNSCSSIVFTQSVSLCTSIQEHSFVGQIKIYPNPSKGIFKIEVSEKIENSEILIYNSIGQLVLKQMIKEGSNTIDISKFSSGYRQCIITENGKQVYREKLIVE